MPSEKGDNVRQRRHLSPSEEASTATSHDTTPDPNGSPKLKKTYGRTPDGEGMRLSPHARDR